MIIMAIFKPSEEGSISDLSDKIGAYTASSTLKNAMDRGLHRVFIFSDLQVSATLDDTGTTDLSLPSVTISSDVLPANATIDEAYCYFKYGCRIDTSAADNRIDGDQYIQVKESVAGSYTNAIKIVDNCLFVDISESTVMGGDIIAGNIDVSDEVAATNKTYNFQWLNCKVDGDNLILYDIQTILELRWY